MENFRWWFSRNLVLWKTNNRFSEKNTFLHESIVPTFLFRMAQTPALYHNRLKSYSKKY